MLIVFIPVALSLIVIIIIIKE
ncbi:excinuclease ABC subunit C, partial [Bacillus thuringiensis]